jgi:hypothetical protein
VDSRSDAAAAKVAELRTMVGERYRDLLSAADSIVRMRSAADKLVDRIDNVHNKITSVHPDGTGKYCGMSLLSTHQN